MGSIARFGFEQNQRIGTGPLVPLAWTISDGAQSPLCCRASTIEVKCLRASQLDEVVRQLSEGHPYRQVALAPIHLHHEEVIFVPSHGASRMPHMKKTRPLHRLAI